MISEKKTFDENLVCLKNQCIILVMTNIVLFSALLVILVDSKDSDLIFVLVSSILYVVAINDIILKILFILIIYLIYKCTKEKNMAGPILCYIFGILLIARGIEYFLAKLIILGVIYVIIGIIAIYEANYFRKEIRKMKKINDENDEKTITNDENNEKID